MSDSLKRGKEVALRFLVYRDRSTMEIRDHLTKKGFSTPTIQSTVLYLTENNYLNDGRFVENWALSRIRGKKFGKFRVQQELAKKGLPQELVEEQLEKVYGEVDEMELARQCAQIRWNTIKDPDIEKNKRRLAQYLQRRGFSSDIVFSVLKQLPDNSQE